MRCGLRIVLSGASRRAHRGSGARFGRPIPKSTNCCRARSGKDLGDECGNLTNQRYSTLKQIDPSNVKQLKGAWMTRLKGSGFGGKYSFEATPLVKDGVMYVVTGQRRCIRAERQDG